MSKKEMSVGYWPQQRFEKAVKVHPLFTANERERDGHVSKRIVLDAKPGATIKDLTDIITDVSAKTIQRDLNSLIERGEVIRQGERRWSKYSIRKS